MPELRELRSQYAPTGALRVALNHGNPVLVGTDTSGNLCGISVDLARALAERLDLPLRFVEYEGALKVSSSAADNIWDLCFLANEPERAAMIDFSAPYLQIDASYLASRASKAVSAADVAASGTRIGAVEGSAYTLALMRQSVSKDLVLFQGFSEMMDAFDAGDIDVVAGIHQRMEQETSLRQGSRVLAPPFMEIRQAIGVPRGRPLAAAHLRAFVDDMSRRGTVASILERHQVPGDCAVIPPPPALHETAAPSPDAPPATRPEGTK